MVIVLVKDTNGKTWAKHNLAEEMVLETAKKLIISDLIYYNKPVNLIHIMKNQDESYPDRSKIKDLPKTENGMVILNIKIM